MLYKKSIIHKSLSVFVLLFLFSTCSMFETKKQWEGISGNELRVYITLDRSIIDDRQIDLYLINKAKQRAILFISSYLRMNLKNLQVAKKLERTVYSLIEKAKLIEDDCELENCYAIYSFDITKIKEFIKQNIIDSENMRKQETQNEQI